MGIEQVFHPDSLGEMIAGIKKGTLGDPSAPKSYEIYFKNNGKGKKAVQLSVYGLDDPSEGLLFLGDGEQNACEI